MKQYSNQFTRINKTKARNLFIQGVNIYIVPCKVVPDYNNFWIQPYRINYGTSDSFDKAINRFEYYNCGDSQTGLYAAYYIR